MQMTLQMGRIAAVVARLAGCTLDVEVQKLVRHWHAQDAHERPPHPFFDYMQLLDGLPDSTYSELLEKPVPQHQRLGS